MNTLISLNAKLTHPRWRFVIDVLRFFLRRDRHEALKDGGSKAVTLNF
jgi:hypothetical protein